MRGLTGRWSGPCFTNIKDTDAPSSLEKKVENLNCLELQDGTITTDPLGMRCHAGGFLYRPLWRG